MAGTELNPGIARAAGLDVRETIEEAAELGPFGCITLWHSLEHLRDPKKVLSTLATMLGRGGVILVAVPDAQGTQAKLFGARWFHLDVPRHLFHFGDRSLTQMLKAAGLVVDRRWHQELEYDMFGWSQSALNTVLSHPNVFFNRLTGRRAEAPAREVIASMVLGTALTALSIPATAAGTLAGKGGTLIAAARRAP
ncbi:MAG: hypothetical protein H6Q89_5728 [Myxococcaceae bacterium]|nr:hypothetical protein [Myxococcaceae bacterium]